MEFQSNDKFQAKIVLSKLANGNYFSPNNINLGNHFTKIITKFLYQKVTPPSGILHQLPLAKGDPT